MSVDSNTAKPDQLRREVVVKSNVESALNPLFLYLAVAKTVLDDRAADGVFFGLVSSYSQNEVHGTTQRLAGFNHARQ